jgi:hypothetical protein
MEGEFLRSRTSKRNPKTEPTMNLFKTKPIDLSDHMLSTYQTLRVVLVVIALLFPWVLWIGGYYLSGGKLGLQRSMSDYYHANAAPITQVPAGESAQGEVPAENRGRGVMRNWFVGVLFAIAAMLAAYKGYRPAEDIALNLAAVFAVLVAVFPTEPGRWVHGAAAIAFFLCIAYVCIFTASATLSLVEKHRRSRYCRLYRIFGVAMAASPVVAAVLSEFLGLRSSYIFVAEAIGVYAFAGYWLVKTVEIRETGADKIAASGKLELPAGKGAADAVRQIPVIYKGQNEAAHDLLPAMNRP